ncbi:DUF4381 domain-containing protein [Marinicella sp. S1101]|uniref:DUF4381 domain-containing protein n=1 Tax=Marinicella marina TaxID=2996016 RepID=UPI002260E280|nr:DUF4381 domain-containing protein [Marinicella marina]MCX7554304.1 DUF4381 domain-containing protein [Marinicella marina]MDJ1138705.1 DUF4381 domain-containing protein [Marinicella marina]
MQAPGPELSTLPLRDIKLPTEPGFWPLAPGWWAVIVLVLVLLSLLTIIWYRYRQKKKRWLAIEAQLSALEFKHHETQDAQQLLTDISAFLRRFVKYQLRQNTAVTLSGQAWIDYLNDLAQSELFSPFADTLKAGAYRNDCEYDSEQLLQVTRQFIKQQTMKPKIKEPEDV